MTTATEPATPGMVAGRHEFGKMGKGHPFHMVAADLDRAWAMARITGYERRLLYHVREQTWGMSARRKAEPVPCGICASTLARLWGTPRQRVSEALVALVADSMLVRDGDRYSIGKDVHAWGDGRITPGEIEYAIKGYAVLVTENRDNIVTEKRDKTGNMSRKTVTTEDSCHGKTCGDVTEKRDKAGNMSRKTVTDDVAPYRNAGASEDSKKIKEDNNKTAVVVSMGDEWGDDDDLSGEIARPLEPIDATLATDGPEAAHEPLPVRVISEDDRLDDKLRGWATALVMKTTGNDFVAEHIGKGVSYWRGSGFDRHVIAAFVAEVCGVKYPEIPANRLAVYLNGIFRNHRDDKPVPPIPPEWKPAVPPRPAIYRPSQDPVAMAEYRRREALQLERRRRQVEADAERARATVDACRDRFAGLAVAQSAGGHR